MGAWIVLLPVFVHKSSLTIKEPKQACPYLLKYNHNRSFLIQYLMVDGCRY